MGRTATGGQRILSPAWFSGIPLEPNDTHAGSRGLGVIT